MQVYKKPQSILPFWYKSWLTIMLWVSIPTFDNSCTNLSVSYKLKNSAMQTQIKVVELGSLNCSLTCRITGKSSSKRPESNSEKRKKYIDKKGYR